MFRKILLTTFALLAFLTFVIYSAWNIFNLNGSAKDFLISKIKSVAGENFSVDKINFGFGNVNLEGVQITFEDAPYEVWIKELRLGYSLTGLLKNSTSPERTADEITIFQPRLKLLYDPGDIKKQDVDLSLQLSDEAEKAYREIIKEYDFIKRITISEGEIEIQDVVSGESWQLSKKINGWAYTNGKGYAWIRVAGHLFETNEYNMVMYGQLDLDRGGLDYINIDLHDYKLGNELPLLLPEYLDVQSGYVNGHLTITEQPNPSHGFGVDGTLSLRDGEIQIASENLYLQNVNFETEIKDLNLELTNASQTINGSPFKLSGRINNILKPTLDLNLSSNNVNVGKFLNQFLPEKKLPFNGFTKIDVKVKGGLASPIIHGTVVSDSLNFFNTTFRDILINLQLRDSYLNFNKINLAYDRVNATGVGTIAFNSEKKPINFDLNLSGDLTEKIQSLGLKNSPSCFATSQISIFGNLLAPVSTGEYNLNFEADSLETQYELEGSFRYHLGRFVLNTGARNSKFYVNASVDSIFVRPYIGIDGQNVEELFTIVNNQLLGFVKKRFNMNFYSDGYWDDLNINLDGFSKKNYEKIFQIEANSNTSNQTDRIVNGDIHLLPNTEKKVSGTFLLEKLEEWTILKELEIGDWLSGSISYPNNSDDLVTGKFNISSLDLSLLLSILGQNNSEQYRGNLFGSITMEGSRGVTKYTGNAWLLDSFLRGLGPLKGQMEFEYDQPQLWIKKLFVEDIEGLNLRADAKFDLSNEYLDANIAGTHVKIEDLLSLLANREDIVAGEATIQVSMKGKFPNVPLYGDILVRNPQVLMMNFDEAVFRFGDENNQNGSYFANRKFHAGNAELIKDGEFVLKGSSTLPLTGDQEMVIDLAGDGNFLSILPDMADLFEGSKSTGHMDLKLRGVYEEPDFTGSTLNFEDGELFLSDVAKKIENLTGKAEVREQDYFLDIKELTGTIAGRSFSISNTNNVAGLDHGSYEPLRLGGYDMNLGALILETDPQGLRLHIPGLMDQGEVGYYNLAGYTEGEPFFITGPWARPNVRGLVSVHSANLMFPFEEGEGNEIVENIMNNINWDVHATSGKDTRYVRQFNTGVYVNMEVDQEVSYLQFNGVMKDSTFTIAGKGESTRGEIEYYDLSFRVDKMGAEFNQSSLYPICYGKAWTVLRDSTNVPTDVFLTLFTVDDLTHEEVTKGRWDRINIKLSSEYPGFEETQTDLMEQLGYSVETIDDQARKAVGSSTDNFLFRPLLRPIERELERKLQLDVVRFSYSIAQNFLDSGRNNEELNSSLALLRSSRLILGKYLTDDVYLLYHGELKAGIDYQFTDKGVGMQHIVGLEYRLTPKWLLQMEYDYNTLFETRKDDKKIWLRHSFPF